MISTGAVTPNAFAVGDFNADGKPDLAVPDQMGNTVSTYLNEGSGTFSAPVVTTLSLSGSTLDAVVSGDFNGDGKADLVVSAPAGIGAIVLIGNGDGSFVQQPAIPGSFNFSSGKVADFNSDGHLDLLLGGDGSPYFFLGKGDGTFTAGSVGQGSNPGLYFGVSAGDFNGDKLLDGIATDYGTYVGTLDYFAGDGKGGLAKAATYQIPAVQNPASVDVADFNGDGKADLLLGGNGAVFVVFGNGDGTFETQDSQIVPIYAESSVPASGVAPSVAGIVADLNQDGKPDAVVEDGTAGLLSLALNDGTGTFPNALAAPYTFPLAPDSYRVATADFNGDGIPDIVVSGQKTKALYLLLSIKVPKIPSVTLTSAANGLLVGSALTFKTAVSGGASSAATLPTGTVALLDGSSSIAQQTLDASGDASFALSSLAAGVHTLTVSYSGDANYAAATSAPLSQAVTDIQLSVTPASQTVSAGGAANYALTLTPVAGFTGTVVFTCSGLPSLATCNAPSVDVAAANATATITVNTVAPMTSQLRRAEGLTYACLTLGFTACFGLRRNRIGKAHLLTLCLFACIVAVAGCGGGTRKTIPGTPSGTSTVTITATVLQGGVTVSHTATATLVVQ